MKLFSPIYISFRKAEEIIRVCERVTSPLFDSICRISPGEQMKMSPALMRNSLRFRLKCASPFSLMAMSSPSRRSGYR